MRTARTQAALVALGSTSVLIDLVLAHFSHGWYWPATLLRLTVGAIALLTLYRMHPPTWSRLFGRIRPADGVAYWLKTAAIFGVAVFFLMIAGFSIYRRVNGSFPSSVTFWRFSGMGEFLTWWVLQCTLLIPLVEELVYRGVVCVAFGEVLGERWAIVISGSLFATLHFVYHAAEPENLIGGFILAWSFFRSRSILVPFTLHAGGNLALGLLHLGATYWPT